MYLEVYADSYFVLQFVMNFYLLELVNDMLHLKVGIKRILAGALIGALFTLLPFVLPLPIFWCVLCSLVLSVIGMCVITFQTFRRAAFLNVLEKFGISTLLLGAVILLVLRILPKGMDVCLGTAGVLFVGGCVYGALRKIVRRKKGFQNSCKVVLCGEQNITVEALWDTGNSLTEPISGKPVAVLDKSIFNQLYKKESPDGFRVIPYHSIGKSSGVLPGYLLQRILVETEEGTKEIKEIYVGISEDILSQTNAYKMILNPKILEKG